MSDNSNYLELEILTPSTTFYKGKIKNITVPGEKSPFQILYNHAPILSSLLSGTIKVVDIEGKELFFQSDVGMVEVFKNKVTIAVSTIQ